MSPLYIPHHLGAIEQLNMHYIIIIINIVVVVVVVIVWQVRWEYWQKEIGHNKQTDDGTWTIMQVVNCSQLWRVSLDLALA